MCPPLCVSVPLTTYLLAQELLHQQPGLRSQNLYPEKAEVILGPAESAKGTFSIYTAHVQKTPRHPPTRAQTQGQRLLRSTQAHLQAHTSCERHTLCSALSACKREDGMRRPRANCGLLSRAFLSSAAPQKPTASWFHPAGPTSPPFPILLETLAVKCRASKRNKLSGFPLLPGTRNSVGPGVQKTTKWPFPCIPGLA